MNVRTCNADFVLFMFILNTHIHDIIAAMAHNLFSTLERNHFSLQRGNFKVNISGKLCTMYDDVYNNQTEKSLQVCDCRTYGAYSGKGTSPFCTTVYFSCLPFSIGVVGTYISAPLSIQWPGVWPSVPYFSFYQTTQ